ncbi:type IV pilin [Salinilacihabitans rarus]|uniref:type IV pilin n=1 Tax=Salinilacihabitans rarus TaxID=2961596 RepID=UPI0020C8CB4C|nr:type IV pilin N-terminal domain-containing protein [Salinilacihabitans rarus]
MQFAKKLIGDEEERAVSPVIGVILMVAITVILAAVIAAFVLDMGNLGEPAPNAQLSHSDSETEVSGVTIPQIVTTHDGGDEVSSDEIRIVVRDSSDNSAIQTLTPDGANGFNTTDYTSDAVGTTDDWYVTKNGDEVSGTISTGDTLVVTSSMDTSTTGSNPDLHDTDVEIQIIHDPSDSMISNSNLSFGEYETP